MSDYVKSTPPSDPELPVLIAGEPEQQAADVRRRVGVPIDATSWEEILAAGESLGLTPRDLLSLID